MTEASTSSPLNSVHLRIDYRETHFVELFTAKERLEHFDIAPLDVGDFHFHVGPMDDTTPPTIIIERKTEADLHSSIKDGRWREQKERLDTLRETGIKVMYILERSDSRSRRFLDWNLVHGAILNTLIRDNYPILYTESLEETVDMIETIYKKLERGDFIRTRGSPLEIYRETSKRQLNRNDFVLLTLSSIPRVSLTTAERIKERYNTFVELMRSYSSLGTEGEREGMLADIVVGKKRLGGKLSATIYKYLYGLE